MGGGDLNNKKSWHVKIQKNQERTWQAEQSAIQERKLADQRRQELREERAQEELEKQLEASGGRLKTRIDRNMGWMYQGPTDGQLGTAEERESFLLGKRRIDTVLKAGERQQIEKLQAVSAGGTGPDGGFMALQGGANNARDVAAKVRDDPLLAIKKQEQAAYEAMMNDPVRRRKLLAAMGIEDGSKEDKEKRREERHRKRRHHHRDDDGDRHEHRHRHRHDDEQSDYERRHKRRRSDSYDRPRRQDSDEDRDRRRRHDSKDWQRDDSRDEERDRQGRRDSRDDDRERQRTSRRSRSRSPRRDRSKDDRQRSRYDPEASGDEVPRREQGSREGRRDWRDRRDESRRRGREDGDAGDKARRDDRSNGGGDGFARHRYNDYKDDRPRFNGGGRSQGPRTSGSGGREDAEEERRRKLAQMQADASNLDQDRDLRLAAIEAAERAAREADAKAREKSSKYGGDRAFVNGLHRQANERAVADRVGRRGGGDGDGPGGGDDE